MSEITKTNDTRRVFVNTLNELNDPKIIVVTCDVGFNYLDDPSNKFKVLNLGVTEQTSMVICAALALSGFKVYFYSMINFSLFRPAEMVRNAVVCHNAPVTIIGVKGSTAYKFLGFSHNMLHKNEDIDFCDNIKLEWDICTTGAEVEATIRHQYVHPRPLYIRL